MHRSNVVLIDLRGFQEKNLGCRHELGVLAHQANVKRVVVLHDAATAREVTESDIAQAPARRFVWLDADRHGQRMAGEILAALMAPAVSASVGGEG